MNLFLKLGFLFGRVNNCSPSSVFSITSKGCRFSSQDSSEKRQYDVQSYQVPLSEAEQQHILEALNTATEEQLLSYKLTKSATKKLLAVRKRKKQFNDIKDLIFVDGIGFKKIELICHHILYGEEPSEVKPKPTRRKGIVQPKIHNHLNITSVVGVAVRNSWVSWCQLQKCQVSQPPAGQQTELQSSLSPRNSSLISSSDNREETVSNVSGVCNEVWRVSQLHSEKIIDFKSDSSDILTGVREVVAAIPSSDVYIIPERVTASPGTRSPMAFYTSHAFGLLAVLLNKKALMKNAPLSEDVEAAACRDSHSPASSGRDVSSSKRSNKQLVSTQSPNAVYYAKEPQLHRSLQVQHHGKRLFGAPVLYAVLEGGDATKAVLNGRLEVPCDVAQKFCALHSAEKPCLAAALCMALAFPTDYAA